MLQLQDGAQSEPRHAAGELQKGAFRGLTLNLFINNEVGWWNVASGKPWGAGRKAKRA